MILLRFAFFGAKTHLCKNSSSLTNTVTLATTTTSLVLPIHQLLGMSEQLAGGTDLRKHSLQLFYSFFFLIKTEMPNYLLSAEKPKQLRHIYSHLNTNSNIHIQPTILSPWHWACISSTAASMACTTVLLKSYHSSRKHFLPPLLLGEVSGVLGGRGWRMAWEAHAMISWTSWDDSELVRSGTLLSRSHWWVWYV